MGVATVYSCYSQDSAPAKHTVCPSHHHESHELCSSPSSIVTQAGSSTPRSLSHATATYTYYHGRIVPLPAISPQRQPKELNQSTRDISMSHPTKGMRPAPAAVARLLSRAAEGGKTPLKWEMASDPLLHSYDRTLRMATGISVSLNDPATSFNTTSLVVSISGVHYPYAITANRTPGSASPFVTVRDVLLAIYANLNKVVELEEAKSAMQRSDIWHAAWRVYRHRTRGNDKERMRRKDFLGPSTVFLGVVFADHEGKLPRLELLVGRRES
ncbi:uncharacterized protein C8Q71DRAFT_760758 [Rhodofomes roseus]|uniref:DUF6699 domain-containing protein n=1 Tax=Rhodofomes roseus TaxID=34475 RepID=A0ABQ8KEG2_9APHY|nr:uncharacterized protein C8Q71DRAFT_760758 [Rhodofomes roseus]KAH9836129.1 hypothetical protein C8Q71DRAFT_760758 [Rhodofomes roseus]